MTDEFAKTLVIDDPNYAPGAIVPPAPQQDSVTSGPGQNSPRSTANAPAPSAEDQAPEPPTFEDTSWLT